MIETKPCPFHADPETLDKEIGKKSLVVDKFPGLDEWAVQCDWCGAIGPMAKTEEAAVEVWNKGYEHAEHMAALKKDARACAEDFIRLSRFLASVGLWAGPSDVAERILEAMKEDP